MKKSNFRFYAELNDFLPESKRFISFEYNFSGTPTLRDTVEAIGVPHTEIDLILVNGEPENFDFNLKGNELISVYPVFESFDISDSSRLRKQSLRETKFVLDVHLGKLSKKLRLLGFDTLYRNNFSDPEIVKISKLQNRIILTRDKGLLKYKEVIHGYYVRSTDPNVQLEEVISRFDLNHQIKPFTRCMECNGRVFPIEKSKITDRLLPKTKKYYDEFYICSSCNKVFWEGSHFESLNKFVNNYLESKSD